MFKLYRTGRDVNEVARVITAMIEAQKQPELPIDAKAVSSVGDRFGRVLKRMAAQLGACYSRRDLELLGWVFDEHADRNLQLVDLLVRQLGQVQDALRKAKARRSVRGGTTSGKRCEGALREL